MLSDGLSKKAIYITVTGVEGSLNILDTAMKYFLMSSKNSLRGRITLKKLYKQNLQLKDIPLSSGDLKGMERELKKYGVDYAIKQDMSKRETYKVFFKAKDIESIELALKNYTASKFRKERKTSFKDTILKYKNISQEINREIGEKDLSQMREER